MVVKGNMPLTQQKFIFQDSINTLGDGISLDMVFFRLLALYLRQTCQPIPGQDTKSYPHPTLSLPRLLPLSGTVITIVKGRGALSTNEVNPTIRHQFPQSWDNTDESHPYRRMNYSDLPRNSRSFSL